MPNNSKKQSKILTPEHELDLTAGRNSKAKPILNSRRLLDSYLGHLSLEDAVTEIRKSRLFNEVFYTNNYAEFDPLIKSVDPVSHYLEIGYWKGFSPTPDFDSQSYFETNPDAVFTGINPFLHHVLFGHRVYWQPAHTSTDDRRWSRGDARHPDATFIEPLFDIDFYLASFPKGEQPEDPVSHYLLQGKNEGRSPAPWFSGWHYLADHPDVHAAGMDPFVHYCRAGQYENRKLRSLGADEIGSIYRTHSYAVEAGPQFEEFDPLFGVGRRKRAKVLAYYLPQFHPTEVNDQHWGTGFTEWRNLPRGMPRFSGHLQPRIPRDLGFYNLSEGDILRRQVSLAKAAGIHGFCFYYYRFDGKRVLEGPVERFLDDTTIDFPFCLMWANENWTRAWDGRGKEVIIQQNYPQEDEVSFVDDLARHMKDPRYIRIAGRPLLFIYRVADIPDASNMISRLRTLFSTRHGIAPMIFQAQVFGADDPRPYGTDGAIEFPPHKILHQVTNIRARMNCVDADFDGSIFRYDSIVAAATSQTKSEFPIIRTVFPSWDNDARRPGRSTIVVNSTPQLFEKWLEWAIDQADKHPILGEKFVCVNAWNEWAEGAYLEPDVHFGAAYLNSVARAVYGVSNKIKGRMLLVGHDAYNHGAQTLLYRIGQYFVNHLGFEVTFLLSRSGDDNDANNNLIEKYRCLGRVFIASPDSESLKEILQQLKAKGYKSAITNTVATGFFVKHLKAHQLRVVSLIHEMPALLREQNLAPQAVAVARDSDLVVFPANVVKCGFEILAGPTRGAVTVRPQGLYNPSMLCTPRESKGLKEELGLPLDSRLVVSVGFADLRKGVDRFVSAAMTICKEHPNAYFLWVGGLSEFVRWYQHEVEVSGLSHRIRFVGRRDDVERFLAAADAFYLSSREDPFPSVVLEALAMGLPVVGHAGSGGCDELIDRFGKLIPLQNSSRAASVISEVLSDATELRGDLYDSRRLEVRRQFDFGEYIFDLLKFAQPDKVSVSVIVPNFNYSLYISGRLWSAIDQDYPLREIIVLDDSSTDDSVNQITSVREASPVPIKLFSNSTNSGSVFRQWVKGVEISAGDYVWIAEADDLADKHFISTIINRMTAANSAIGFCDSRQIDESGALLGESYKSYLNDIEKNAFDAPFDMDGQEFLRRFLSVKNVILNVSGAIIRRDSLVEALNTASNSLFNYRVAGDWFLYCLICAQPGARVSYVADPLNTHRKHGRSVTGGLDAERHLKEVRDMHSFCGKLVKLSREVKLAQKRHLVACENFLTRSKTGSRRRKA